MKTLGWLAIAVVMAIGGLIEYGGPGRAAAPVGHIDVTGDAARGEPPAAVRSAMAHLREEAVPGSDGTLVIANEAYRTTFSAADGVVYTPRHAGKYEPRLAWKYRARTLSTGAATRTLETVAPAVSATGDHVVDFTRSGLIERYEGERTGVEQIFVLPERPAGGGDVRIVGDVTFKGTIRPKDGGLEFDAGGGLPVFIYAKPIAFDANQAPVPVRVDLSGTKLALVLDGVALEHAQWPVTIDPLFGTSAVDTGFGLWSSVTYNWARGEFLVVYHAVTSVNGGWQIRARRYFAHGSPAGDSYGLVDDGDLSMAPAVAFDLHTNRYLVVWVQQPPNQSEPALRVVKGLLLDTFGAPVLGPFALSGMAPRDGAVDVVARNFKVHQADDPSFLVVWSQTSASGEAVYFERVRADGVQAGEQVLDAGGAPAAAFDPQADRFLVTYIDSAADMVKARSVPSSGSVSGEIVISPFGGMSPDVDYDMGAKRFFVAWRDELPGDPPSMWGRFLSSGTLPAVLGDSFLLRQGLSGENMATIDVTSEAGTFVAQMVVGGGPGYSVLTRRWRADGLYLGEINLDSAPVAYLGGLALARQGFLLSTFPSWHADDGPAARVAMVDNWSGRWIHGGRAGDFDGDGRSDLFLYRQSTYTVYVKTQTGTSSFTYGIPGGVPALLDYDGDGLTDIDIWEPSTGKWWIRKSNDLQTVIPVLGSAGDTPAPGDYYGLGGDQVAIFRPSNALWVIQPSNPHLPPTMVTFGEVGDLPTPADWDGDGDIDLGVWRPSTGRWYARDRQGATIAVPATPWGQAGDVPLAGNFTGSGVADQVVYRKQLGVFFIRDGQTGATQTLNASPSGVPVPLDWNGTGYLKPVLFNASSGLWRINANTSVSFGGIGDIPAGAQ